jgi:hypothetical protein
MNYEKAQRCIDICFQCSRACDQLISQILSKRKDISSETISRLRECASISRGTAALITLHGSHQAQLCHPCADICDSCIEELAGIPAAWSVETIQLFRRCADECRAFSGVNA